jgi:hypothetical protein
MQHLRKLFQTIPLLCLLLTGCASISEVKKEDRDLTNSYDGVWVAKYETTKRYQKYKNWTFTCGQGTSPLRLLIEDSGIRTSVNYKHIAPINEAYISSTGSFKTSLPLSYRAKTSKYSDTQDSDVETRIIIKGILNPEGQGTGRFTFGYAISKFKGCNTELIFTKSTN